MKQTFGKNVGQLLREWRERRRFSQMHLALEAEISPKHLSFLETGRAKPSREMLLRLAQHLTIPLRERNVLLTAAGFAPFFAQRSLEDPSLSAANQAINFILTGHEPNPALAIDRHWNLIAANKAVAFLLSEVDASLLEPPINVLRLSLHPSGLSPQIINYAEWKTHLFESLHHQIELTADAFLIELLKELKSYPTPRPIISAGQNNEFTSSPIAVPLRFATAEGELSFWSTTTVFGTPVEVSLAELAIESFFPSDTKTAEIMADNYQKLNPKD